MPGAGRTECGWRRGAGTLTPDGGPRFIYLPAMAELFRLRAERKISWRGFGLGAALASYMDEKGECFPSRAALSERTGLAAGNISIEISHLIKSGWITIRRRSGRVNIYCFSTPTNSETGINSGRGIKTGRTPLPETGKTPLPVSIPVRNQGKNQGKKKNPGGQEAAVPPDPRVKEFVDWYFTKHKEIRGAALVVNGGKDGANVKRLLGTLDLAELQARAERFIRDQRGWPENDRSISAFAQVVNRYGMGKPGGNGSGQPINMLSLVHFRALMKPESWREICSAAQEPGATLGALKARCEELCRPSGVLPN